jgi:hypothetical protein
MNSASEGETLGIYLEDGGEGEIHRGMDLSDGREENPPRIHKKHWGRALVARESPLDRRSQVWGEERGEWTEGVWEAS